MSQIEVSYEDMKQKVADELRKHQKGYLFDHHKRIGDTAGPEFGPKLVNLALNSVYHCIGLLLVF